MSLQQLNDKELIESTNHALESARKAEIEVLRHFREIDARRLWVDMGSLYKYLSQTFKLTDDQVYPRLQAMRLIVTLPEVEKKLENGQLNITNALKAQQAFRSEAKKRKISVEEKREVISQIENLSTRQVAKVLAEKYPDASVKPEKMKPVSENRNLIQFYVDDETLKEIDLLKAKYSHQMPDGKLEKLFKILVQIEKRQSTPRKKSMTESATNKAHKDASQRQRSDKNSASNLQSMTNFTIVKRSRHISADTKREMEKTRSQGCVHTDASGNRCGSIYFLQRDHIHEFSLGGSNEADNLRWLCGFHNRNRGATENGMRTRERGEYPPN